MINAIRWQHQKRVGLARGRKTRQIASPRSNQIIGSDIGHRASQIRRFPSLGPCPVDIKSQVRHCPSDSSPEHLMLQQLVHAFSSQWWPFLCCVPCPCSLWVRELHHIARPNETEEMLCGGNGHATVRAQDTGCPIRYLILNA